MNENNLNNQNLGMNNETNTVSPVENVPEAPVTPTETVSEVAPVIARETATNTEPVMQVSAPVQSTPAVENTLPTPTSGGVNVPQNDNGSGNDKKKLYLVIGIVALIVVVIIVLLLTVFKDKDSKNDYDDYVKEEQKTFEDLNEHFTYKDFEITNGILVEINNDNKVPVMADVKVEFLDESGALVDVTDSMSSTIDSKKKSYVFIGTYDINYSSYKITVKLNQSYSDKLYVDSIEVVSANVVDDTYLIQLKNNSDVKLDIYAGILFYQGDNIVGFSNAYLSDVLSGETTSDKVYIPTDDNYETIKYTKAEVIVLSAYDI